MTDIRLNGRPGDVDSSAGVGHVDSVAVVEADVTFRHVNVTCSVCNLQSAEKVFTQSRALDVHQTPQVDDGDAPSGVIGHVAVGDVEIVSFAESGRQFHVKDRPLRSFGRVEHPDGISRRRDTLRTCPVAYDDAANQRRAFVRTVTDRDFRRSILIRSHVDEVQRQYLKCKDNIVDLNVKFV